MLNAYMVFTQTRILNQEGGEQKWQEFVTALHQPPVRAVAAQAAPQRLRVAPSPGGGQAFEAFARAHAQAPPPRG